MTHDPKLLGLSVENALFTDQEPTEVLKLGRKMGFKQAMLIGGMTLNTSFLQANLIDEIWLDVHPLLIGNGKTVFNKIAMCQKVNLLETKLLGDGQVLLKYKIDTA